MLFDAVQNIRLSPRVVTYRNDGDSGMPPDCRLWCRRGLRARLVAQSFVTGQKSIELNSLDNGPAHWPLLEAGGNRDAVRH